MATKKFKVDTRLSLGNADLDAAVWGRQQTASGVDRNSLKHPYRRSNRNTFTGVGSTVRHRIPSRKQKIFLCKKQYV